MYTVSENYETVINGYSRHFQARLLKNGEIVNAEIKKHSVRKYSSTGEDISIGCAFASSAEISCIAASSLSSLKDSEITLETGLEITSGEYEYVPDGVYTITSEKTKGEITTLIGYDRMYVKGNTTFSWPIIPVQYSELVTELATQLGVEFDSDCLEEVEDFTIEDFVDDGDFTLQKMAGYLAGLIGRNAYINRAGQLTFQAYADSGYIFDGNRISDIDVDRTVREINWLQCTVGDETLQSGIGAGYAKMENPLMNEKLFENVSAKLPVSYYGSEVAFLLGDPRLDPWDMIWYKVKMVKDILVDEDGATLVDEFGNVFADWGDGLIPILCHETTYSFDGGLSMDITSYALSETEENTNFRGPTQQAVEKAQQVAGEAKEAAEKAKKEVSRYADAVNNMSQLAMNSLGFYQTIETLPDGSIITYMHDKPTLAESQTIYKRTIDGFFVSRDGGETYTSGFDSNGNAVLNVLSVIGINFDWAYGGTLTLGGDANGHGVLNIVDEDGEPIVIGDNSGLTIYKGKISFSDVTDSDGNTLEDRISDASSSGGITEDQVTEISRNEIKTAKIGADQIYGNTLTLGGSGNANGTLVIKDADGNAIVTGNKDGLFIDKGTISWNNVSDTDDVATKDDIPDDAHITQITKDTVTTSYINALDITAKYINVSDKSSIAGWNISVSKIYSGDSNVGVAVMQRPSSEITYVFAAGGISHDSYEDCPYRVTKDGKLYASRLYVTGDPNVDSGEGFYIYDPINEEYLLLAKCDGGIEFPAFDYRFTGGLRIDKLLSGITPDVADTYKLGTASKYFNYVCSHAIRLGCSSYSDGNGVINSMWKDGEVHDVVNRSSDGLTSAFGWAGDATYKTVTKLRGQTIQYSDSSGTTTLSDERLKKDFMLLDAWEDFYEDIEPCAFKYVNGASGRSHIGFKAQQIQTALELNGLTTQDFAGFVQYTVNKDSDEWHGYDTEYGLIYTEFVALNTYMIQKLMKRIDTLESKINPVA